jgi:hypothetical protein
MPAAAITLLQHLIRPEASGVNVNEHRNVGGASILIQIIIDIDRILLLMIVPVH